MKLSKRDRKLARIVRENPRIHFKELGSQLNISDVAARKRFFSLLQKGLFQFELVVPIEKCNIAFGRLDIISRDLDANHLLLERSSTCPRIRLASVTTGEYNFMAIFVGDTLLGLQSCIDHYRAWNRDEILRDQFVIMTNVSPPEYIAVPLNKEVSSPTEEKSEILRLLTRETVLQPCGANCTRCQQFKLACSGCPLREDWNGLA